MAMRHCLYTTCSFSMTCTAVIPLLIVVAGAGPGSRYYNNEVL